MFWSLLKKLSHAPILGALLIFSPPDADAEDQLSFVDASYQLFQGKDFDNSLVGKFASGGCAQILSRRSEDHQIWIAAKDKPAIPALGIPDSFPLDRAFVVDLNQDGLSDLFAYDKESRKWQFALGEGEGRFHATAQDLPPLNGPQPYAVFGPFGDRPVFIVDLGSENVIIRFSPDRGLFLEQAGPKASSVETIAIIDGAKDRALASQLSTTLFRVTNKSHKIDRLNREVNFTWADFPLPIDPHSVLSGDFNGDGFGDILTPGWHFQKWWMALGADSTAIEYPIAETNVLPGRPESLTVADIDCDGKSDLLVRKIRKGNVQVFYSRVGRDILANPDQGNAKPLIGRALSSNTGPFVCVGYVPFSLDGKWGFSFSCPKGYAVSSSTLNERSIVGACCRLPQSDILLDERVEVTGSECPENMVVTGSPAAGKLSCSPINLERYSLRERSEGVHWGFGSIKMREPKSAQKERIPLAIRYSFGRRQLQSWYEEGCAGYPWGSLLAAWGPRACAKSKYQTLVYKGAPGDPPKNTPVVMFPECSGGVNPFDPNAGCFQ